jgi:D-alanine--poly(phosphoribitol) ligase subunit 1
MEGRNLFHKQVLDPFLNVIRKFPNENAFCINGVFYTYKQLGEYISKIRFALSISPGENINIGLVVNDSIETYASIFAALTFSIGPKVDLVDKSVPLPFVL